MYQVQVLSDKGIRDSDGLNFHSIDDAVAHTQDLVLLWIIVEWRVIDEKGAEVKRGYFPQS